MSKSANKPTAWDERHATQLLDAVLEHERSMLIADEYDEKLIGRAKESIRRETIRVIAEILAHQRALTLSERRPPEPNADLLGPSTSIQLMAERLIAGVKKTDASAVAKVLAELHESAVICAVVRVERKLEDALEAATIGRLESFGGVIAALENRSKRKKRKSNG